MSVCLVAMGANVGDRAATLDAAMAALAARPDVRVVRQSVWHATMPVGGTNLTREFLNGAALLETTLAPLELLGVLQKIEITLGRQRKERWADRAIDLDLLLCDEKIVESPRLVVPHPRMSYRRFVLVPAVEIAAEFIHPTIGWSLSRLLNHLDSGADRVAIVSPDDSATRSLANTVVNRYAASFIAPPLDDPRWPAARTTWIAMSKSVMQGGNELPKLTVLLDPTGGDGAWTALAQQQSRGPTLRVSSESAEVVACEVFAAVESVWPHLGRPGG